MNEKDAIKDLFSNAFEQHASPVRPEVWQGLQSKMAAAGMAGGSGVAAVKGISALTKWIIGGAAVVGTATIATVAILNSDPSSPSAIQPAKKEAVENTAKPATITSSESQHVAQANPHPAALPRHETFAQDDVELQPLVYGRTADDEPQVIFPPIIDYAAAPGSSRNDNKSGASSTPPATPANTDNKGQSTTPATPETVAAGSASSTPVAVIKRIPNTFTPNYDGDNDVFFIQSENITDFSVLILNAQGEQLYRSADPDFRWDGTDLSGNPVPGGQYKCVIIASGADNKPIKRLETVVIAR